MTGGHAHEGGHAGQSHGGHAHLSHVTDAALPAVFAARADAVFRPPAHPDELESLIVGFFRALSPALTAAGCTLVGHIKGTLAVPGHGDLAFHLTDLGAEPALTGGVGGLARDAVLTVNVIVFGVDERALPALVRDAWSATTDASTAWRL